MKNEAAETACEPTVLVPLLRSGLELSDPHDDVRGLAVLDAHGRSMGEVEDLVIDETHRRARLLVVVTAGDVPGRVGAARRLIPVDVVTDVDEFVHVAPDPRAVQTAPTVTTHERHVATHYADVYASYGCTPYWGLDYITPYFHRR